MTNRARLEIDRHEKQINRIDDLDPVLLQHYRQEIRGRSAALRGTTHISVVDSDGNQASLTVNNGEGCGYLIPGTGIMLNNMLGEEDLNLKGFHCWDENQRITSMMAPSILDFPDGKSIVMDSGGSNRIRSAILQVISNLTDFAMSLEDAIHFSRLHYENNKLSLEKGFDQQVIKQLQHEFKNHQIWDDSNLFFGGVHAVVSDNRSFYGVGDPRRGGFSISV